MNGIPGGWGVGLLTGLCAGAFFGIMMSLTMGTVARRATRGLGPGALTVHQVRVLRMRGDPREVVEHAAEALATLPRARHVHVDADGRTARARTSMNWKSFGEEVSLYVRGVEGGYCRVRVESRPRVKTTLVDYGLNTRNVEALAKALGQAGEVDGGAAPSRGAPVVRGG